MEYLVHSLRYTMSGRRLEAVELPEAPSQRKSAGHIVLVEHLCTWSTMEHLDNLYLWSTMEHLLWSTLWHSDIIRWFGYITRKTVLRCSFQGQGRCGYVVIQLGTWKLFAGLTISNLFHTTNDHQQRRNEYQEL